MRTISKEAFQKAVLLTIIGQFDEGVYSELRLHKVAYFAQKDAPKHPFTYKYYNHGQFSFDVREGLNELENLGMVQPKKLKEAKGGQSYFVTNQDAYLAARNIVRNTAPDLMRNISHAVEQYGYKSQDELLDEAYEELEGIDFNEVIVEDDLPLNVEVDVPEDENQDFELASNPFLIDQLSQLSEVLNSIELDEDTKKQLFDVE